MRGKKFSMKRAVRDELPRSEETTGRSGDGRTIE